MSNKPEFKHLFIHFHKFNKLVSTKSGEDHNSHLQKITHVMSFVQNASMSTEKRGNASMTWGNRKSLLQLVYQNLLSFLNNSEDTIDISNVLRDFKNTGDPLKSETDILEGLENPQKGVLFASPY